MNMDCYIESVMTSSAKRGWSKCWGDLYYVVGVYRGGCFYCTEMIRCCRMLPPVTHSGMRSPDMVLLGHWLLNGGDNLVRFSSLPSFTVGRCPNSKAVIFNQTNSFASTPIIIINSRSFTIALWIKQKKCIPDQFGAIYSDWFSPWQFLLSTRNKKIQFHHHQHNAQAQWWFIESSNVSLDMWTHVALTWDHVTGSVFIYVDGKKVGYNTFTPGATFYQPTGRRYQIGNDGHWNNHQFFGSVMDLYVFGAALSLDEINRLRGVPVIANTTKVVPGGTVVVAWQPPLEGACPVEKYTVYYRKVMSSSKWHLASVSRNTTSYTLHLKCGSEYDVTVTSLSGYGESLLNESKIWNFKTSGGIPVIANTTKVVPGGTVVVAWEPPLEEACPVEKYTVYYREVMSSSKWHSVSVNRNTTSYTLHLNCGSEYDVAVTSASGYGESLLKESKIWNFKTSEAVPSPPVINSKETESLTCNVNLTWSPPDDNGCQLTLYSIYYQQIQPQVTGAHWHQVNVMDIMKTRLTISLACDKQYKVEMSAWNRLGQSDRSKPWMIKTKSGSDKNNVKEKNFVKSPESETGNLLSAPQLTGLIAGLVVLMVITFMVVLLLVRRARRKRQLAGNERPRRSKSTIIPLPRWEVLPEQVVFGKEIGCGAFGKVFKGTFRESPGIEVFYEPRSQLVDFQAGRTVAIKVLGDRTDEEAKSQFLDEIELMKAIGSHKNVLSMLGCWVSSDPIFLVLEYVPYGDLLHWLRNKRIQKSYQKNYDNSKHLALAAHDAPLSTDHDSKLLLSGDNEGTKKIENCRSTMDRKESDSACSSTLNSEAVTGKNTVKEAKPDVEGRILNHYEKEPTRSSENSSNGITQQEEDFSVKDLLSFAWQIARGMNFLSSNGFVHRDLAARNILLAKDKVVKISDFGLMRQTHDSVYQVKKGKKLPVKWMAPEALYNSEYTTKSDVWSFGILLWELSTMGGNPYPGINNKELYNLLKTGYRMERPDTCSDKLYQLMLNCWKEEPSERPTFESATRSLEQMLQEDTPYLDLETLDESKPCYCNENLSDDDIPV
ncbi:hypothetical protein ACROYT_G013927 [Oculina patagonica]